MIYICTWIKHHFNKTHLQMVWNAFTSETWDFSCTETLMYYKLVELQQELASYDFVDMTYEIAQIRLAIKLNLILRGKTKLLRDATINDGNNPKLIVCYNHEYVCIPKVNIQNIDNFVSNSLKWYYQRNIDEFYMLKARHLYYRILDEIAPNWSC